MPRIIPAWVIAGVVMVGDCDTFGDEASGSMAFARPKSSTLTAPHGHRLGVRVDLIPSNGDHPRLSPLIYRLWRAVDQDCDVIDILLQPRRDRHAAARPFANCSKRLAGYHVASPPIASAVTVPHTLS